MSKLKKYVDFSGLQPAITALLMSIPLPEVLNAAKTPFSIIFTTSALKPFWIHLGGEGEAKAGEKVGDRYISICKEAIVEGRDLSYSDLHRTIEHEMACVDKNIDINVVFSSAYYFVVKILVDYFFSMNEWASENEYVDIVTRHLLASVLAVGGLELARIVRLIFSKDPYLPPSLLESFRKLTEVLSENRVAQASEETKASLDDAHAQPQSQSIVSLGDDQKAEANVKTSSNTAPLPISSRDEAQTAEKQRRGAEVCRASSTQSTRASVVSTKAGLIKASRVKSSLGTMLRRKPKKWSKAKTARVRLDTVRRREEIAQASSDTSSLGSEVQSDASSTSAALASPCEATQAVAASRQKNELNVESTRSVSRGVALIGHSDSSEEAVRSDDDLVSSEVQERERAKQRQVREQAQMDEQRRYQLQEARRSEQEAQQKKQTQNTVPPPSLQPQKNPAATEPQNSQGRDKQTETSSVVSVPPDRSDDSNIDVPVSSVVCASQLLSESVDENQSSDAGSINEDGEDVTTDDDSNQQRKMQEPVQHSMAASSVVCANQLPSESVEPKKSLDTDSNVEDKDATTDDSSIKSYQSQSSLTGSVGNSVVPAQLPIAPSFIVSEAQQFPGQRSHGVVMTPVYFVRTVGREPRLSHSAPPPQFFGSEISNSNTGAIRIRSTDVSLFPQSQPPSIVSTAGLVSRPLRFFSETGKYQVMIDRIVEMLNDPEFARWKHSKGDSKYPQKFVTLLEVGKYGRGDPFHLPNPEKYPFNKKIIDHFEAAHSYFESGNPEACEEELRQACSDLKEKLSFHNVPLDEGLSQAAMSCNMR
ncbi:MAG: hypothetical protein V3V61_07590 [Gammaproteobacteria bacterium]